MISLIVKGKQTNTSLPNIVCKVWHGPGGPGRYAKHKDGDRNNNAASNLEWGSHHNAKLTSELVIKIRSSKKRGVDLAREYGVSAPSVNMARRGYNWKGVQYV